MLRKLSPCILLIFVACSSLIASAQNVQSDHVTSYRYIGMDAGMSAKETFTGLIDGDGFAWFGTANGLNRYDGKTIRIFSSYNAGMRHDHIIRLATDLQSHLFILYGNTGYTGYTRLPLGKIDVMDVRSHTVAPIQTVFPKLPFKESDVWWITGDADGSVNFFVAHPYTLWQYKAGKGFTLRCRMNWDETFYKSSIPTGPNQFTATGTMLLGFSSHQVQYLLQHKRVKQLPSFPAGTYEVGAFNGIDRFTISYQSYDQQQQRLFYLDTTGKLTAIKDNPVLQAHIKSGVSFNAIDNDTTSLVKVPGSGWYFYNSNGYMQVVSAAAINAFNISFIYQVFSDKLGNTWVCTSGGVYQVRHKQNKFTHYFARNQQSIETNNQARGIYVDQYKNVYANIWTSLFIQSNGNTKVIPSANGIMYALFPHRNTFFTTSSSLQQKNIVSGKMEHLSIQANDILSAAPLNDSIILLGRLGGISQFNLHTREEKAIANGLKRFHALHDVIIEPCRFLRRKDSSIWILGGNQLLLLNKTAQVIAYYDNAHPSIQNKMPGNSYTDLFEDATGLIWLTTKGNGLYKWNRNNGSFTHYGVENGMPSSVVYRMEADKQHNLWISSENGLVMFNPATAATTVFSMKDGLSDNEFNRLSSFTAADGQMFFGGINGVNAFYPEQILNDTAGSDIPLRIISFRQYDAAMQKIIDKTPELLKQFRITLQPGDKFFDIEYNLLSYEQKITRYAYKLEGQDKDWVYTTDNSIRFSGLPYGNYTLHIKAQTGNGQWSTSELMIPVQVVMPWYRNLLIQLLGVILLLGGITGIFLVRTVRLQREKKRLGTMVDTRTRELQQSLGERELLLKEIHHRVKNNLQVISGLLDLQKEEIAAEESKAVFNEGQSRVKSIALIHQNLYQNDDLANIRFRSFVKDLAVQVTDVFEQLHRKLDVSITMPDVMFDIDTAVPLALIINELLTNAFKYATQSANAGKVNITLTDDQNGNYTLRFTDDGPGLHEVDFASASTLGLRLIKGLSAQLYGDAAYHYDHGSVFTIRFKDSAARRAEG